MRDNTAEQKTRTASTPAELVAALQDNAIKTVVVEGTLASVPSLMLRPGKAIEGLDTDARIVFAPGEDGVALTSNNSLANIRLQTDRARAAILNDTSVSSLGTVRLRNVAVVGRVRILAREAVRGGHVDIDGLDVIDADARAEVDRPDGFGVHVIQGAFTLWNMQPSQRPGLPPRWCDCARDARGRRCLAAVSS
jgi:hypothetical protein